MLLTQKVQGNIMFFMLAESILRVLPRSNLGPRTAGIQVHPMQTARAQEMPQSGTQAVPKSAAATTAAERRVSDDRQKWRPTA